MNFHDTDSSSTSPSPYAEPSPTNSFIVPPARWFEVTTSTYDDDGSPIKETVLAHSVTTTEAGCLVFQTMRPGMKVLVFDPNTGESPANARPIGPPSLEFMTTDVFASGMWLRQREIVVPTSPVGRAN